MPAAWPYRVTLLAPILRLPHGEDANAAVAAALVQAVVYEHLAPHPILALTDPDDLDLDDDDGRLLNAEHPRFRELVAAEHAENRRDEVVWFELWLHPAQMGARLHAWPRGAQPVACEAGGGTLSGAIELCVEQWLAARGLPRPVRALEPFALQDFIMAYRQVGYILAAARTRPAEAAAQLEAQQRLAVPILRLVDAATELTLDGHVLARDPAHAKARFHAWQQRAHAGAADHDELRRIVALAPMWGRPHLAMTAPAVPAPDELDQLAAAARLMPRNVAALDALAGSLRKAQRFEEALRAARRATRLVPTFVPGHAHALHAQEALGRHGEAFLQAQARARLLAEKAPRAPMDRHRRDFLLAVAYATFGVGRLDDAILRYREALDGATAQEAASHQRLIAKWQSDREIAATAYAREASHRNDPAGVIAGYARGRVSDSSDAARLVAAYVDTGQDGLARAAWAHLAATRLGDGAQARLAGARALILGGDLARAFDELQHVALRHPQSRHEAEIERLLRLAATRPVLDWETALQRRHAAQAVRLCRLLARDAFDFVPGIERSGLYRALGGQGMAHAGVSFDPTWLDPLRAALGQHKVVDIDLYFHRLATPSLDTADRLVNDWPSLIAPRRAQDPTADAQGLFVLGHALTRYLALTTQAPTPLGGGYRQVATGALLLLGRAGVDWLAESIRPFLAAIESVAPVVDPWLLDAWLLRVERALDLDACRDGTTRHLAAGLPHVSAWLRGDEQVAIEWQLAREPGDVQPSHRGQLYERTFRAIGTAEVAAAWAAQAAATLPARDAADVRALCAAASPAGVAPGEKIPLAAALARARAADPGIDAARIGPERAAFLAAGFRSEAENMVPIAAAARGQLDGVLAATAGQLDAESTLARLAALRLREDVQFPVDPPPPLGPRIARERFS